MFIGAEGAHLFRALLLDFPYKTRLLDTEIYARRKSTKGMSQYALAEKIGVSRNCIYLLECHAHIPKIETIYDIIKRAPKCVH